VVPLVEPETLAALSLLAGLSQGALVVEAEPLSAAEMAPHWLELALPLEPALVQELAMKDLNSSLAALFLWGECPPDRLLFSHRMQKVSGVHQGTPRRDELFDRNLIS
jgi:hypothetical protein